MSRYHIAQVNIGRIREPLDSPVMAGFVGRLDEINALADHSSGFVWRLQTSEGNATYFRPYGDDRILLNMSVWESVEALRQYVYGTAHMQLLRRRHQWFEKRLRRALMGAGWPHSRCRRNQETAGAPRRPWAHRVRVHLPKRFPAGRGLPASNRLVVVPSLSGDVDGCGTNLDRTPSGSMLRKGRTCCNVVSGGLTSAKPRQTVNLDAVRGVSWEESAAGMPGPKPTFHS